MESSSKQSVITHDYSKQTITYPYHFCTMFSKNNWAIVVHFLLRILTCWYPKCTLLKEESLYVEAGGASLLAGGGVSGTVVRSPAAAMSALSWCRYTLSVASTNHMNWSWRALQCWSWGQTSLGFTAWCESREANWRCPSGETLMCAPEYPRLSIEGI